MFGCKDRQGRELAFHLYSMKQAIEEGFIIDVLQSYATYETMNMGGGSLGADNKKKLSEIIDDINARTGLNLDVDEASRAIMQIRDLMMRSDDLRKSARNNSEDDFRFSFYSNVEDALIAGFDQNKDFYSLLLDNKDIQKEVLGLFIPGIYKNLRQDNI
ncbi:hypothetical protein [Anaerococcus sp. Marseille-P3915]|uniref:hypothetical protein n=1 Tax=Anaerococcus sp. Marseille-P3915 TaxID=2057799 RepID=UPI000D0BB35D|nr:hypothetical protein [Anaerococcus sp. Marseille-P3915]